MNVNHSTQTVSITPEVVAGFVEAMANDRATRLQTVGRATVVIAVTPEWMRREEVTAYFGIPPNQLYRMVRRGGICAKKLDPDKRGSAVIFRTSDIRRAIETLPDYRYEADANWRKLGKIDGQTDGRN